MKTNNNNKKVILIISILILGLLLLSGSNIFAKENPDEREPSSHLTKSTIQNYMIGLCSDNEGLRTSCIFFSGKYKISEAQDILKSQFEKEQNPEIKLLLFHALNQIGDKKAVSTVNNYLNGLTLDNEGVRKCCIDFAGKYKISEAIDTLTDLLYKENDLEIHELISNALSEIASKNVQFNFADNSK